MRLSPGRWLSDWKTMERYVCERIPSDGARVVLAAGEDGESWADLSPVWVAGLGWELHMERSDEWVSLQEVFDHFRRQEMTYAEWWRDFEWRASCPNTIAPAEGPSGKERRYLTAHDIVEHYQGKISLRLAYQIMDLCQPVRAGKKRLVTAESFREYLRAASGDDPPPAPEPSPARTDAAGRKRGRMPAGGFKFFRFPP